MAADTQLRSYRSEACLTSRLTLIYDALVNI